MLLAFTVAVWTNPDFIAFNFEYAAFVAGTLVCWFVVFGGWRVALIARGAGRKYGDRVYLGLCGTYAVALIAYTGYATLHTRL
ncbi:MAG: hypothetical protein ACRDP6_09060 [Actinoallomurus sp.]